MTQVAQLLGQADAALADCGEENPRLAAEILLAHVLQKPRSWLYAWPEAAIDSALAGHFQTLVESRCTGTPVAHLTGTREFWSLPLRVNSDTLIPRPETELLVEQALGLGTGDTRYSLLDLGTGSGAVALAIAAERAEWHITATDNSTGALDVARENAALQGNDNIEFLQGDWFSAIARGRQFDIIVSNPPYIAEQDPHLQQGDLRFEPDTALASGPKGLDDLQQIVNGASGHLHDGGWLLVEHGLDQGAAVQQLFRSNAFGAIATISDLENRDRVTVGQK